MGYSWVIPQLPEGGLLHASKRAFVLEGVVIINPSCLEGGGGQATSAYACPYPHSHPNPNNSHLQCPRGERKIFRALPGDSSWGGVKLLGKTGSPPPTHLIKHVGAIKGEDGDPTPYPWPPKYQPRLLDCLNQGVM